MLRFAGYLYLRFKKSSQNMFNYFTKKEDYEKIFLTPLARNRFTV